MGRLGCPAHWWLLCMIYVVNLLNIVTNSKGFILHTIITGEVTNISPFLDYHFWQEVFVEDPTHGEQLAYWCGPADKQGDFLTYHVLLHTMEKLLP